MSNTELDHLAIVAPTLAQGVAYVEECLGVAPGPGGKHALMGTHNRLVQLGAQRFLEVIAIDPDAPKPDAPRWFGLDEPTQVQRDWAEGRRLRTYVARTEGLDAHLKREAPFLGVKTQVKRGDLVWHFGVIADGTLPLQGAAPHLMDWGASGTPAARMSDGGLMLKNVIVETPVLEAADALLQRLEMRDGPILRKGPLTRLFALIDTPRGPRLLT